MKRLYTYVIFYTMLLYLIMVCDPYSQAWGLSLTFQFLALVPSAIYFLLFNLKAKIYLRWSVFSYACISCLFLALLVGGGVYIFGGGELESSAVRIALPMLIFFLSYPVFSDREERLKFMRIFEGSVYIVALIISLQIVFWSFVYRFVDVSHVFHEEIFILAGASMISLRRRGILSQYVMPLFFMSASVFTMKNTGALVATWSAILFVVYHVKNNASGDVRLARLKVVLFSGGVLMFSLISLLLALIYREYLPDGSPIVRGFTYSVRISEFMESFLWGSLFTKSLYIDVYFYKMIIPSHSDILDFMSFGGILGLFLFLWPVFAISKRVICSWHVFKNMSDLFALSLVFSCFLLMSFNPFLLQPALAVFFWLGISYFLARRVGGFSWSG